jgi:excisionase family DNA binding protein
MNQQSPTNTSQHQPTQQDHDSMTVIEEMASLTQQIHLSQVKATGTPTSHGAIMNNQNQHPQPHDHDLLTITEAADLIRTPKATLRYWRHLGTGPRSFRLGRRVLYRANDLHEWIAQHDNDGPNVA